MPADFGFCDCSILQKMQKTLQKLQKITFCLQNIKSNCTESTFWSTITSAGREARKEKITMEKSIMPCGASPQEWRYIDALGADCRYIVPIVSNPDLPGVGSLLRVQKTRGKIPSVKDAFGRAVCLSKWQTRDSSGAELKYWS